MSTVVYKKHVSALDVAELLKGKGVEPSNVTVEEDGQEVRIIVLGYNLTEADKTAMDALMKMMRR